MPPQPPHFVFVDFENIPSIDLALLAGKPVHVTLFIGEKQKRLELPLVRQIHHYAAQVRLVEVGATGRNALDLVLAAHLGRAMAESSSAAFTILSRDHDFDPLVAHFSAAGLLVRRESDLAALPVFGAAKSPSPGKRRTTESKHPPGTAHPGVVAPTTDAVRQQKRDRLVTRLQTKTNRPKTRLSLLHHINAAFGQKLTASEQEAILDELVRQKILTIPDGKKVQYSS